MNAKNWHLSMYTLHFLWYHSVYNATQCIIFCKVCNLRKMCDFTHKGVWFIQCVYHLQNMLFLHPSSVTQHLHSVCNFTHFFYFVCIFLILHKPCVLLHSGCSFTHFFIAWPNKSWFTLLCRKILFCNLPVFQCKFHSPNILPVKKW